IVNAAAVVNAVSKKTGEVVDRSKLVISSTELKKKISAKFETLGRYIYDTYAQDAADSEVVSQYISEINELISQLKSVKDMMNASEDKVACPKCSAANTTDSLYCKKCGATLDFSNTYTAASADGAVQIENVEPVTLEKDEITE
nr:zinc ribbon domain-containing protein [Lachnospiraceae bacterium]